MNLSVKKVERDLKRLRKVLLREVARAERAVAAFDAKFRLAAGPGRPSKTRKRRKMSKAARARISAGMKRRHRERKAAAEKA
jgi:hypothetical protein